jgi:hypothetical protein
LNEQVFEVVRTLTIRRRVPTGSLALLRETLARQTEIEGWEVLDAPEPQFHPVAVPLLGQHEPCIQVEYDEDFYGQGIHSADGDFAYIPQKLILALGIEVAFELVTGLDPVHILQWDESGDPLYKMNGDWWEEEVNDTTSPLHEEQPVRVIHQGEHLGDTGKVQSIDRTLSPFTYYVRLLGAGRCLPFFREDLAPLPGDALQEEAQSDQR